MLITFDRYKYFIFFCNSVIDRLPSLNTYVFAGADELQNRRTMQVQVNLFAQVNTYVFAGADELQNSASELICTRHQE